MGLEQISIFKQELNITNEELSQKSGVPKSTIDKITSGRTCNPNLETVKAIVHALGKTLDDIDDEQSSSESGSHPLTHHAYNLGRAYDKHTTPEHIKKIAWATLEPYMEASAEIVPLPEPMRRIDYYDESPAAGVGTYLSDSPAYNTIELPSRLVPKTASFCCRITGDSMEPTYPKYCKVFVEARPMIESGEDGIFVYNGTSVFKRLLIDQKKGIMRLTSINPTGPTFEVGEGDDVYTVGKVVGIYVPEEMK